MAESIESIVSIIVILPVIVSFDTCGLLFPLQFRNFAVDMLIDTIDLIDNYRPYIYYHYYHYYYYYTTITTTLLLLYPPPP